MTAPPVRCAVVGTGLIAHSHARAIAAQDGRARLVAAVEVDEARLAAFTEDWPVSHAGSSLGSALASGEIDLVIVCTQPSSHVPLAVEALAAGVNVLVEKPPAVSLADFDVLARAASASAGEAFVVSQHRFGSAARQLRRLAGDGVLGRPLVARCETTWYRDEAYFAVPWRGSFEVEGGGPTIGHGVHQTDLMLSVLGPWAEVTAMAGRQSRPTRTEDVSCAVVRFENGALATVTNSVVPPREASALRFDWEHATVELHHLYGYGDDNWQFTAAAGREDLAARWATGLDGERSGHAAQLRVVLDALASGATPPVTLADARLTLEVVAAVYASAFTGRPVRRGEIVPGDPFYTRMDGTGAPWRDEGIPA
ncbi:Gfo/Idh/MocA family oxidoreductase [Jiangella aurantiaca]|uniref:Gfo/Idh/MocA family oxidoreductase n=1 Tax=Jiangella aurantiaca TaxID=2530373 RepID=A0A4V6PED4_9ACTN|nr:Gfo/Idh/MocA family oxidoreductase [Jiangella aurantiaca]TDD65407.1 Gfo/Idh/MocA family oxidoreductase [Jiangella aurantiaca]